MVSVENHFSVVKFLVKTTCPIPMCVCVFVRYSNLHRWTDLRETGSGFSTEKFKADEGFSGNYFLHDLYRTNFLVKNVSVIKQLVK